MKDLGKIYELAAYDLFVGRGYYVCPRLQQWPAGKLYLQVMFPDKSFFTVACNTLEDMFPEYRLKSVAARKQRVWMMLMMAACYKDFQKE